MALLYEVEMQHSEESFKALAHMQYDLFCRNDRVTRTIISFVLMVAGVVYFSEWWGILMVAYGCYLTTSTYTSANRTAHKLTEQIKNGGQDFPASRFVFGREKMEIYRLPDRVKDGSLAYAEIHRLGADTGYFYIFRDQYGGYMIPKAALGEKAEEFRDFLEEKTGQNVCVSKIPIVRLFDWIRRSKKKRNSV